MFCTDIPNTVMVNAVGNALLRDNMVKGKKFHTLTADYVFGHDLLRAAKAFFDANGATLIGDELVATNVDRFQPLSAENPPGQAGCGLPQSGGQSGDQFRQAICRIRPALPDRRVQPQYGGCLGRRQGQPQRHLADGLVSHARHARLESIRRGIHARSTASRRRTMPGSNISR